MKKMVILSLIIQSILLAGCSAISETVPDAATSQSQENQNSIHSEKPSNPINNPNSTTPNPGDGEEMTRSPVDWSKYDQLLQDEIDSATSFQDCKTLNFLLEENKNHAELVNYIEDALVLASCE